MGCFATLRVRRPMIDNEASNVGYLTPLSTMGFASANHHGQTRDKSQSCRLAMMIIGFGEGKSSVPIFPKSWRTGIRTRFRKVNLGPSELFFF